MRRRVLLGAVLGALFALGWWVGGSHASRGLYSGLDLFVEVLRTVQANYVDPVDPGRLVTGAMRGVTHSLDPWSRYLDPEQFRALKGSIQGEFDGIGATLDQRDGWPVVIAPIEGSPAWDAGLMPGDIISSIEGRSTFGLSPDEVGAKLRGAASTKVTLEIVRGDDDRTLTIERRRITVHNVPYAFIAAPGVGYLRLAHFSNGAAREFAAALDTLRRDGAHALVLDLRGNPGGTIDEAVSIAGRFLPKGVEVTRTEGRAQGVDRDYVTADAHPELDWPLALLVDRGSASASEILAGALQDHDRGILVGDTTFGKGVAQQIYPLRGSLGAVQLTVSHYLTPSGRSIHRDHLAMGDDTADAEEDGDAPADGAAKSRPAPRTFASDGGRPLPASLGLAPELRVEADSTALARRLDTHHPGGPAGAARDALTRDPVFQRALQVLQRASDARGVFAAAGVPAPNAGGVRR